jgi:hypothetical protein
MPEWFCQNLRYRKLQFYFSGCLILRLAYSNVSFVFLVLIKFLISEYNLILWPDAFSFSNIQSFFKVPNYVIPMKGKQ